MPTTAAERTVLIQTVISEINEFCEENANPELAKKYSRYFREGYDAYGIDYKNPEWTRLRTEWLGRLCEAGPSTYLDAGDILTRTGKYEHASVAIRFAADMRAGYSPVVFQRIGRWFDGGIRNWGHTDVLCSEVLCHFLLDNIVDLTALEPWRDSEFKYKRRAVPVMMIPLMKKTDDHATLFALIEPLMTDPERVVHQGVGWFLREAWKCQPKPAEKFLLRHKETAPRLIFQYATEKMTPAQRLRFRRS